jgi:hypothetical protein
MDRRMSKVCKGIAVVLVLKEDDTVDILVRNGNKHHDILIHELVPVELHNRTAKVEYLFPNQLIIDAPDDICKKQVTELGFAVMRFGVPILDVNLEAKIRTALENEGIEFNTKMLDYANLRGADLGSADLRDAYLEGAYLRDAYLGGADLRGAYLGGANLRGADLGSADLEGAYLRGADLEGADLEGADLGGAYLEGVIGYEPKK